MMRLSGSSGLRGCAAGRGILAFKVAAGLVFVAWVHASAPAEAAGTASVKVTKTAFVDGQNVCGVIRITNVGQHPAILSGVADSLEVHFPRKVIPPPLPAGSTKTWFKVTDVAVALPGPIAPGATATIDYCFPLCFAADFPGANSMRNVVAVTVANHPGSVNTVTTRSESFPPPVLDCQACCLGDGSCTDTLPGECGAAGGQPKGLGTECASTQCTEACCLDDGSCEDVPRPSCEQRPGNPQGAGTTCDPNLCPQPFSCCTFAGCTDGVDPNLCEGVVGVGTCAELQQFCMPLADGPQALCPLP